MGGFPFEIAAVAATISILVRFILWPYLTAKKISNVVSPNADSEARENAREELGETGRKITSYFAVLIGAILLSSIFILIAPFLPQLLVWVLAITAWVAGFILYRWAQNRI